MVELERVIDEKLKALPGMVERAKRDVLVVVEKNSRLNNGLGYSILAAAVADLVCDVVKNNRTVEE